MVMRLLSLQACLQLSYGLLLVFGLHLCLFLTSDSILRKRVFLGRFRDGLAVSRRRAKGLLTFTEVGRADDLGACRSSEGHGKR